MSRFNAESPSCCSTHSSSSSPPPPPPPPSSVAFAELKLYQAFIFSVPIFFTFILLFLFYFFYLRRRRVDWASLRMRANLPENGDILRAELGLKKELREMLPIIVYKESFSVEDTQCPVCLGDYQAEDRLQQIPACGHTFHMECIDHWLANHTTCPLCRLSLIASAKVPNESPNNQVETGRGSFLERNTRETSGQSSENYCGDSISGPLSEPHSEDSRGSPNASDEDVGSSECAAEDREVADGRHEAEGHESKRGFSEA